MKFSKTMVAVAVGVAGLSLATPSSAMAADATLFSETGKSYAWYDDSTNRVVVCDMVNGDGDGAIVYLQLDRDLPQRLVYNGCDAIGGVPDGVRMRVTICDWGVGAWNGQRNPYDCRGVWLDS